MDSIKEKAEDAYYEKFEGLNLEDNEYLIVELMIEFAKECCEEQKLKCFHQAAIVYDEDTSLQTSLHHYRIDKDSIVNCKNICDE